MITLFTDPTGLVPVVTGLITTGHSHFPADPTGLVPVVNRFDHYINGRLTAPVCSFQTLLPPAQGRRGVLHANIYIIGVSPSLDYPYILCFGFGSLASKVMSSYRTGSRTTAFCSKR